MLERERLDSKKISKTNAVTSIMGHELPDGGRSRRPLGLRAWLTDRKWAHIRIEGKAFGDVPLNLELKLEVWDSPNSAGVVIDAVRLIKLALNNGISGQLDGPSSYLMKSPAFAATRRRGARADRGIHRHQRARAGPRLRGVGKSAEIETRPRPSIGAQLRGLLCCLPRARRPLSIAQVTPYRRGDAQTGQRFVAASQRGAWAARARVVSLCQRRPGEEAPGSDADRHRPRSRAVRAERLLGRAAPLATRSTSPPSTRRRSGCSRPRWRGRWWRSSSAGSTPAR